MNKMMLTLAFTAMIGGSVLAQDNMRSKPATAADRSEQQTEMMIKRLKLSDEQVPKVKEINARYGQELAAVRQEHRGAKAAGQTVQDDGTMAKAKALNEKRDEELKGVLTPEQMAEWQKMEAQMKQRMQQKRQARQMPKAQ